VKPRLVFVSPLFLFPADAGGKIRTGNILRGLRGGHFEVTLMSPATSGQRLRFGNEIAAICDRFVPWQPVPRPKWLRALDLLRTLPVNVAADLTRPALAAVRAAALQTCDLMVFDFVHAAVLRPPGLGCASICFTHNVEAEIFARHAEQADSAFMRWIWAAQHRKMDAFEAQALKTFTSVIAVSERDADFFRSTYGLGRVRAIPTGVDLDYFSWQAPVPVSEEHPPTVVFTGSMDSAANIGGVKFFIEKVWPAVLAGVAEAQFLVVGRNPPASLLALGKTSRNVRFTGAVDDIRPFTRKAHVAVIPLLVGGGTRIKAFEAMAMGCPVVSTSVGIEGLAVEPDVHFINRDDPDAMASAIVGLLADAGLRMRFSRSARERVEQKFGHAVAARAFEEICVEALSAKD